MRSAAALEPPASAAMRAIHFAVIMATLLLVAAALIVEHLMAAGLWRIAVWRICVGGLMAACNLGIILKTLLMAAAPDE